MQLYDIVVLLLNIESEYASVFAISVHWLDLIHRMIKQMAEMDLIKVLVEIFKAHIEEPIISMLAINFEYLTLVRRNSRPECLIGLVATPSPLIVSPRIPYLQHPMHAAFLIFYCSSIDLN